MSKYERGDQILHLLLEQFYSSKKFLGENKIQRRCFITPDKAFGLYYLTETPIKQIHQFEDEVSGLEAKGWVNTTTKSVSSELERIYLEDPAVPEIENYLSDKYGTVPKGELREKLEELIGRYSDGDLFADYYCMELRKILDNNKKIEQLSHKEDVLRSLHHLSKLEKDLYIREYSMMLFGDSKKLENEVLKEMVRVMSGALELELEDEEEKRSLLNEYHLYFLPGEIRLKGAVQIRIYEQLVDVCKFPHGVILYAADLPYVSAIRVAGKKILTIENLTTYIRYSSSEVTLYLGGFHNLDKKKLLLKLQADNQALEYHHWGDIDAGGFYIYRHLTADTSIDMKPFRMGMDEIGSEKYRQYCQPLTINDRKRLKKYQGNSCFDSVIDYMLEHNIKLEQEIISLLEC